MGARHASHPLGQTEMWPILVLALAAFLVVGCADTAGSPTPAPTLEATPTVAPAPTPTPGISPECAATFAPLAAALGDMAAFVSRDRTLKAYGARIDALSGVYDNTVAGIPGLSGTDARAAAAGATCLEAIGGPARAAVDEYVAAYRAWQDQPADEAPVKAHWTAAAEKANALRALLAAYPKPSPIHEYVTLTGTAPGDTAKFQLVGGNYGVVFSGTASVPGGAGLDLYNAVNGEAVDHLVKERIGKSGPWSYDARIEGLDYGTYYLEVGAPAGTWSVALDGQR